MPESPFWVLFGSVLVALALSHALQLGALPSPILALANTARIVSERRDYSVRAPKSGNDELGLLTEAFNQMLTRIQQAEEARSFLAQLSSRPMPLSFGKDLEGTVVSWNAGAERMFGYTAAEMIGQPVTRIGRSGTADEESRLIQEIQQYAIRSTRPSVSAKTEKSIQVSLIASPVKDRDEKSWGSPHRARHYRMEAG